MAIGSFTLALLLAAADPAAAPENSMPAPAEQPAPADAPAAVAQPAPSPAEQPAAPTPAKAQAPTLTKMPVLLRFVEAAYPEPAKLAGLEGEVVLQLIIDKDGKVQDAKVKTAAGHGFDEAALAAAWQFLFSPAEIDGVPASVGIEYRTAFKLRVEPPSTLVANFVGQVIDEESGEVLVGASIFLPDVELGSDTDASGSFAVASVPAGAHPVRIVAFGHEQLVTTVNVDASYQTSVKYRLSRQARTKYESRVVARRLREEVQRKPLALNTAPEVSRYQLTRRDIELTAGSLEDISRVVTSLPGVVGDADLLATFFVRGGGEDEVTFYLDGVPLSNPYHLGGFTTLFNPELIREVSFFAGGQPAPYRSSLSGILDVGYLSGSPDRHEAMVDLSANTAKLLVAGPTPVEGLSLLLSARRSYFELYFILLKQLGIVGSHYVAPDIGEYEAKATYRSGKHTVELGVLQADDGLAFVSTTGESTLIPFDGTLRQKNDLSMLRLSWDFARSKELRFSSRLGLIRDSSTTERSGPQQADLTSTLLSSADTQMLDLVWRLDADWNSHANNHVRVGVDVDWWRQTFSGHVEDTRAAPRWVLLPIADYQRGSLDINPRLQRADVGLYAEDEWKDLLPGLTPRVGLRCDAPGGTSPMLNPRLAVSYQLFAPTVLKAAFGTYFRSTRNPLEIDTTYGNPKLTPERSTQYILGLEQLLPLKSVLKVEGYYKALRDLIVNPDDPAVVAQGVTFTNDGSGWAYGADALLLHRGEHLGLGLSYGYLRTERTNPLNTLHQQTYAPAQDQTHTLGASADYSIGDSWVLALKYQFHTGRPTTALGFALLQRDGQPTYVPIVGPGGALNADRLTPTHDLSARVEWWYRRPEWRMTVYAELLNALNEKSVYVYSYDKGDPAHGIAPTQGSFNHLPIRPFLGVRGEY